METVSVKIRKLTDKQRVNILKKSFEKAYMSPVIAMYRTMYGKKNGDKLFKKRMREFNRAKKESGE